MSVHPLFGPFLRLCIHELNPCLVPSHDSVEKFVPLFPEAPRTSQLVGVAMSGSMFTRSLLMHNWTNWTVSWRLARLNFTGCYRKCAVTLRSRFIFTSQLEVDFGIALVYFRFYFYISYSLHSVQLLCA
jgi:hypothetical protein